MGYIFAYLVRLLVPLIHLPQEDNKVSYWYFIQDKNINWCYVFLFSALPSIMQLLLLLLVYKSDVKHI